MDELVTTPTLHAVVLAFVFVLLISFTKYRKSTILKYVAFRNGRERFAPNEKKRPDVTTYETANQQN